MRTVLIADDQPALRLLVSATLGVGVYEVIEVADGTEAWNALRAHRPGLAILDLGMPGRSGLELTRDIKQSAELKDTKVIILTGEVDERVIQAGLEAGAEAYLTKPFSPLQLLAAVEAAFDTHRNQSH